MLDYDTVAETERVWVHYTALAGSVSLRYSPAPSDNKLWGFTELVTRMNGLMRFPLSRVTI